MKEMKRVLAITGGIGSGKSVVSRCLRLMGIPVYDCDKEAKRLNHTHPGIRQALTDLVGAHVYQPDGTLDKGALATYLFADATHAARINAIIHPVVREDFLRWKEARHTPWVAFESAILFESGFDTLADKIVMVTAPEAIRLRRAMLRDHATPEAIRRRMQSQLTDAQRAEKADLQIVNDDRMPLIPQILDILGFLFCQSHE